MGVILAICIAITTLLLPLDVYPGLLSELALIAFIGSPFWMPLGSVSLWVYAELAQQTPSLLGPPPGRGLRLGIAASVLVLNLCLLWWNVPRRLAFLLARPAFEASAAEAPGPYPGGREYRRRLGVYQIERLAADPRGGVYFHTRSGMDGFYTSQITYGFCLSPNREGSAFGDKNYTLSHVVSQWYAFQASR